ncbi:MAG: GNAT family N-acetyltransferase [Proteobacteria bacterium]|jgi:ribosomal-protein-alanine N-acetyltransferase|nr:GNAT family N-acetyltransferase [Pseudomonadota bacterium]
MTPHELSLLHKKCFTFPRPWSTFEFEVLLKTSLLIVRPNSFLLGRLAGAEAEILTLAVDPDHRLKGLGYDLIAAFISEASLKGASQFILEVSEINIAAIKLYKKHLFKQIAVRPRYYSSEIGGEKKDALVLSYCPTLKK